jgi:hypothetical protein
MENREGEKEFRGWEEKYSKTTRVESVSTQRFTQMFE